MARLSAATIIGFKTGTSNSVPTTTQASTVITNYYKLCYNFIYGPGTYGATEANDVDTIIDTDEFRIELDAEVSAFLQAWHMAAKDGNSPPRMGLSDEFKKILRQMSVHKRGQYSNVRLWGADTDDLWVVPR